MLSVPVNLLYWNEVSCWGLQLCRAWFYWLSGLYQQSVVLSWMICAWIAFVQFVSWWPSRRTWNAVMWELSMKKQFATAVAEGLHCWINQPENRPVHVFACDDVALQVVKALKKSQKGFCVIAGNISPIDVISHLPVLCEEANVPYIYVPSKEELGAASYTKRPTSCMLILAKPLKPVTVRCKQLDLLSRTVAASIWKPMGF